MVNIAFTITPMSAPGSAARLAFFRLTSTHCCCSTWGLVFILVFQQECVPNAAVCFKAISPMTQFHRFLVSLHIHDTTASFRISPCPLCSLLWISGFRHSTEIGSRRNLLRLLIIFRPDTLIFLTGERISVFFRSLLCLAFGIFSSQLDSAPSTLLSGAAALALVPTGKQRKLFRRRESLIS